MNLVQIQERLKDAPIQSIMQYANGGNPMVPPYLALAELKRRESISQSAQSQQAMQQGQPRSVKEQIEQTAGLAALQQRMQQQGMQGLMAQARPQGIPEGVPQPSRQPESEGLAGVPVSKDMFNFSDGGIVAFAKGDLVKGDEGLAYRSALQEREQRGMEKALQEEMKRDPLVAQLELQRKLAMQSGDVRQAMAIQKQIEGVQSGQVPRPIQPTAPVPVAEMATPAPVAQRPTAQEQPPGLPMAERRTGQLPPPGPSAGGIGLPSARMGAAPQTAPDMEMPATGRGGLPAIAGSDEAQKMMLEAMRGKTTLEDQYAEQQKAKGLFGLQQPYGEERMKRAQAMEAARQQELEGRGMERLMRVMGGIGARGLGGAGTAYLQSIEGERAADAAFRKQMDELLGGVEEKRRAEAVSGMTDAQKTVAERKKLGLGAAEKVYDAQRKREDEAFKIRLENQLRTMQPTEASILLNVMADIRRRNPGLSEEDVYAKAREAQQGASPESRREETRRKYAKDWNDIIGNILLQKQYKEMGIDTFEKYLRYVGADTDKKSERTDDTPTRTPSKPLTAYER
jgi:hypothetical protein